MNTVLGGTAMVAVFLVLVSLWAVGALWAVNTLFGLGLAYSVKNVLAAIILGSLFSSRVITQAK